MPELRFGAHYRGGTSAAEVVAYARRIESLGFDGFWVTDGGRGRAPLEVLATAAAVGPNLDLGTAVLLLPFWHPTLLARAVATLDGLSGGRVMLGVGVGGERAPDFQAYGMDPRERGPRANEALALLLRLWQEQGVSHAARFYSLETTTIDVRPVQKPHPPVLVGGRLGGQGRSRDAALRRAARYGDGWLPYLVSPEQYAAGLQRLAEYAAANGRDAATFMNAVQVYVGIYGSQAEAHAAAMATTARTYNLDDSQVDRFCTIGTKDAVVEKLRAYVEAGALYFVVHWACGDEDFERNLETLGSEIIPALRT